MKSKLQFQTLAAIGILFISLTAAIAQPAPSAAPATPGAQAAFDPVTGLPSAAAVEPQWIDPNWSHSGMPDLGMVTNVSFHSEMHFIRHKNSDGSVVIETNFSRIGGVPAYEVANQLRKTYQESFDILPMPHSYGTDWGNTLVNLELNHVRASEVFNAMNMIFENDRTPIRWQLKVIGGRPVVMLRVLPEAAPQPAAETKPPEIHRMVYFVGDLLGDEKTGGMSMNQIADTIMNVWPVDFGRPQDALQFHDDAQMLVVKGTSDQLEFVHQTLVALKQKVDLAHQAHRQPPK